MLHLARSTSLVALLAILAACGGSTRGAGGECAAGPRLACACGDGRTGSRACGEDGCVCPPAYALDAGAEANPLGEVQRGAAPVRIPTLAPPDAEVFPTDLDFGEARAGCVTRDRELQLINVGSSPLRFESVELESQGEYLVRARPREGTELSVGQALEFTIAYRPVDDGEDSGLVSIRLANLDEPLEVALRGRGDVPAPVVDVFHQNERPKADILVVIDNGTSMTAETARVVAELGDEAEKTLRQEVDFHLAVTTTGLVAGGPGCPGGANGGEDGRLFPVDGSRPRILDRTTPNLRATFEANLAVGTCHAAPPQTLEAAVRALAPPLATSADDPRHAEPDDGNLGFLRPDAYLSVIAVSDRADASPGLDDEYYQALLALKGGEADRVNFHAVTGDPSSGCSAADGRSAAAGDRLLGMVERTQGGMFESICGDRWFEPLWGGEPAFGFKTCFFLQGEPEDANRNGVISDLDGELRVRLDGVEVPSSIDGEPRWSYSHDQIAVCFHPVHVPEPGTTIEVEYRVACLSW